MGLQEKWGVRAGCLFHSLPMHMCACVRCLSLFFRSFSVSVCVCLSRVPRGCLLLGQHSFGARSIGPGAHLSQERPRSSFAALVSCLLFETQYKGRAL